MKDTLREEAVEVKYNGFENTTKEDLKNDAIINAVINDINFPNRNDRLLSVQAFRSFEGKECTENDTMLFVFYLFVNSDKNNDQQEYEKVTFVIDGQRVEIAAQSKYLSMGNIDYLKIRKKVIRGNVITIDNWESEHWEPNDYICDSQCESADMRRVATAIPDELIRIIAESENVSMYVDSSELIDVNGGYKKTEDLNTKFEIEGIQGFMKRVYHFFIDDSCYTDYCLSFYDKKTKTAQKRERELEQKAERDEQAAHEEAMKLRNIFLVVLALSLLILILGLCLEWGFFWSILLPVIGGGYSIFNIGRLYDIW